MKSETEWFMNRFLVITFLALGCANVLAQGDYQYRVLPEDFNTDKQQQMMRAFLRQDVHAALDERLRELEAALPKGIYVTGSPFRGIGLPDCVLQGQKTAAQILAEVVEKEIEPGQELV